MRARRRRAAGYQDFFGPWTDPDRRELLLDLSQWAAEAVAEYVRREVGADTRPVIVVSIATSGLVQWHAHGHLLVTEDAFSDDAAFHPLPAWDGEAVMRLFRERLLARLIEPHAISADLARKLLAWKHPSRRARPVSHRVA